MNQLIDDLLAFSRLGRQQIVRSTINMENLCREVWDEIREANPDRVVTVKMERLPPAMGDRALIKQVVKNLLENAFKFTRDRAEAVIEISGFHKEKEMIYSVGDNGVGFDMAYYDKLFGVFQRLHSPDEYEGTGIGLSIVQRIIYRHGGRVWAESKTGQGACFYFSIPQEEAFFFDIEECTVSDTCRY